MIAENWNELGVVSKAMIIAGLALGHNRDWEKLDYSMHSIRVGIGFYPDEDLVAAGILHDVVEDNKEWTFDRLRQAGFSERTVKAVESVTRRENEKYFDFIVRTGRNPDGVKIKIADLEDNLRSGRTDQLFRADYADHINKYTVARYYLMAIEAGRIDPGTSLMVFLATDKTAQDFSQDLVQNLLARHSSESPVIHTPVPTTDFKP